MKWNLDNQNLSRNWSQSSDGEATKSYLEYEDLDLYDAYNEGAIETQDISNRGKYNEVPMYTSMRLNPAINDTRVRCNKGDNSNIFLIYVYSAPSNFEERLLIRNTWGSVKHYDGIEFRTVFFIGKLAKGNTNKELLKIRRESEKHGDLVQDLSYVDSYRNLTLKGISALHWIEKYCPSSYRVQKVDDDTVLNPRQIVRFLKQQNKRVSSSFVCKTTLDSKTNRDPANKYYVSKKQYHLPRYPEYCQGFGYSYPSSAVPKILQKLKDFRPIPMEDAFFTGIHQSIKFYITL
ncbi:B3GALT1 [Bugula neritina]|uniref:Hexosyltransferase n=1 Tax=Bugula neritina TaxID=10212 RepID=A0A7J7JR20_BUGNE|nr:B3GALT1 [Bugula neritina]